MKTLVRHARRNRRGDGRGNLSGRHGRRAELAAIHALLADAGHRAASRHDARAVLRLAAAAQRRHPGGLLGQSSRYAPNRVVIAAAGLGMLQNLAAGDLVYDPATEAAIALAPQDGERRARRGLAAAGAGLIAAVTTVPIVLAVLAGAQLLPDPLPDAVPFVMIAGAAVALSHLTRALRRRRRHLAATVRQGPTIYAGSYVGAPGAGGRLLEDLVDACDRAGVTLVCETTGEARIRLFRTFGFRVVAITVDQRPRRRHLLPPRAAKVFMARAPAGTPPAAEVAEHLWRRPRPSPTPRPTAAR